MYIFIFSSAAMGSNLIQCGGDYSKFLRDIGRLAINEGIDRYTVDLALASSKRSQKVLEMDRKQSTFRLSFLEFSKRAINSYRLKNGKRNIQKYSEIFEYAEIVYGVPAEVITAFWAMETDFGAVQGKFATLSALATLAHDCRRPELFQNEYLSAIRLLADGVITENVKGAWAGEIGQVQMLPSDILTHGQDGDGDGLISLKKSAPDSILTAAALISSMGWKSGDPWIEEVILRQDFNWSAAGFGRERTLEAWKNLGIQARDGSLIGEPHLTATLLLPQGRKGPKFLAYPNFNVYLRWNDSFIYTITAAHLATRLGGHDHFISGKPEDILKVSEMIELQRLLKAKGYDVGKVDGILGRKTRQSVRAIQLILGMPADSWPTVQLLHELR